MAVVDAEAADSSCKGTRTMSLIKLNNVHKIYHLGEVDVPVLKGVSLEIGRGEYVALMGASGSGKSTLMNILGCLDRPSSGEYWLDGQEVSKISSDARAMVRNKKIGFVFQNFNLLGRTTAVDQVAMPLSYTNEGVSDREAKKRATELLKRVGLGERIHHYPSQLSGGQQQRVALARALVTEPSLLLGDEPTGALDSKTGVEVLGIFDELNRQGVTIVVVTHDHGVARHARRVIEMRDGKIIRDGAPE